MSLMLMINSIELNTVDIGQTLVNLEPQPRKPSQQSLMTRLIKSTPTIGQSLVKELVKP
jgi:hypothetical protein